MVVAMIMMVMMAMLMMLVMIMMMMLVLISKSMEGDGNVKIVKKVQKVISFQCKLSDLIKRLISFYWLVKGSNDGWMKIAFANNANANAHQMIFHQKIQQKAI